MSKTTTQAFTLSTINKNLKIFNVFYFLIISSSFSCTDENKKTSTSEVINNKKKEAVTRTIIIVKLKPKSSLFLNGFVFVDNVLKFENKTNKDTLIKKYINIKSPTTLYYLESNVNNGNLENKSESLLLLPQDSIIIDNENKKLLFSTSFTNFLDKLISIPKETYPTSLSKNKITSFAEVEKLNTANVDLINKLNISDYNKASLLSFNQSLKNYFFSKLLLAELKTKKVKPSKQIIQTLTTWANTINLSNDFFKQDYLYNIIALNVFEKENSINIDNFWSYFDKVNQEITTTKFYSDYVFSNILLLYKYQPPKLKEVKKILTNSHNSSLTDSLKLLVDYLVEAETNAISAKEKLKSFQNGVYSFIISGETIESKNKEMNIGGLKITDLVSFDNHNLSLQTLLKAQNTKLYFIDVWASWCTPCIAEFKPINAAKEQLKDYPIKFISLSIDKKEDLSKWKKVINDLDASNSLDHYLINDAENSPFRYFFNIEAIPRFIIINSEGKIIDENFIKPSNKEFVKHLKFLVSN